MAKPKLFASTDTSQSHRPSSTLLSLLAILVSSSSANASPAPPLFLCPNYKRDTPSTIPTPFAEPRRIPNKYVKGDDGFWRRVESYTLYGSTVPCTGACLRPTQVDQLQVSSPTSSATSTEDIRDSLPPGWKPMPKPNESRTTLILALSLVLALFICFFIISCVFWRKSIIKQRRRDLEAKFKKHHLVPPEETKVVVDKANNTKQKLWARATARWKANVRHAARQRKGKRVAASKSSQASRSRLSVSLPSPASSRRSSFVSVTDDLPHTVVGESPSSISLSHHVSSTPTSSPHTNPPISPPAYHHGGRVSPMIFSHPILLHRSRRPSHSSSFRSIIASHNSGVDTPKPPDAAHVATDDKALLARLAGLSSRPPEDASTDALGTCDTQVSVPAWHDELEEFPPDLITSNDRPPDICCVPSSLFPPPPSKTAAADNYGYSFGFEDMAALEPEHEPSAPPFLLASAPPLDDNHQIGPSAPPLTDDTELRVASAPQWESTSAGEENPTGQDHDRIRIPLTRLPHVESVSNSSQDIGMTDSITLPDYRP